MSTTGYDDNALNTEAIRAVTKLIDGGRSLCFVGAGLSVGLQYPQWSALVERIENLAVKHYGQTRINDIRIELTKSGQDPASRTHWCQCLKNLLNEAGTAGAYHDFLREEFSEKDPSYLPIHTALVRLPFQHFITTNYDPAIECAEARVRQRRDNHLVWTDRVAVTRLLRDLDRDGQPRRIFHIHGRYDNPDSLVLTSDEYDCCYNKEGIMTRAMWTMLSVKYLIFFGFSFDKEDVYVEIVKRVNQDLQQFSSGHFAFLPLSKDVFSDQEIRRGRRQSFRKNHGVEPIFYEVTVNQKGEEDHSQLTHLVLDMQGSGEGITDLGAVSGKNDAGVAATKTTDKKAIHRAGANVIRGDMELRFDYSRRAKR